MSQDHERSDETASIASDVRNQEGDGIAETDTDDPEETQLTVEVERLAQENERLRQEYARAQQVTYRKTAVGLFIVGVFSIAGATIFPAARTVLLALGGIGVFASILTYYLTPERVVPETVGSSVYQAHAATGRSLLDELGLTDQPVYVPLNDGRDTEADARTPTDRSSSRPPVRLFLPQSTSYELPAAEELTHLFVAPDETDTHRGVALKPTGASLFAEFERALTGELAVAPATLAAQLSDALVEQFELVEGTTVEADADENRVSIGVRGCVYGDGTQFDHPAASFLGTGFAHGLGRPIAVETTGVDDTRAEVVITCRWEGEEESPQQ